MPKGVGYRTNKPRMASGKKLSAKQRKLRALVETGKMPTKLSEMPKSARKGVKVKPRGN